MRFSHRFLFPSFLMFVLRIRPFCLHFFCLPYCVSSVFPVFLSSSLPLFLYCWSCYLSSPCAFVHYLFVRSFVLSALTCHSPSSRLSLLFLFFLCSCSSRCSFSCSSSYYFSSVSAFVSVFSCCSASYFSVYLLLMICVLRLLLNSQKLRNPNTYLEPS